jgi:hypothetical protein
MNEQTTMSAYKAGFDEGQKHVAPSPETMRMLTEMREEWSTLKTRALYALIGSLSLAVGYGIWVGTIQTRLSNNEETQRDIVASVAKIDGQQHANDVSMASIKAELASINTTLVEIKNELKKL